MICPFCQSDNPARAQFCRACGVELDVAAAPAGQNGPTIADALPVGTLLAGTYAVESVLGQGGFGITYRCHDQMLDRRVAIKEFFPASCRREASDVQPSRGLSDANFSEARAQFLAEARLLARCHHAGIVGVYTAFEANQTAYMVMELLHGRDLAQLLLARGGRLSEAEAVPLIERAGEALQFVHETGLLHRDIKPENIIACDDGRVMLIDFGTAREYIKGQTQGHTIVVTPGYAPLEQYARQARRGAFTDVYGLAATLYHLLTGSAPPAASDRAMGVRLRPVREENPQLGRSVAHAVEAALQMEIARRPQSVRAFLDLMRAPEAATPRLETAAKVALAPQNTTSAQTTSAQTTSAQTGVDDEQVISEAEMARQTAAGFSPFFSPTALEVHQQMIGAMLPSPSPVKLAPPTPFPSAAAPTVSPNAAPTVSPNAAPAVSPNTAPNTAPAVSPGVGLPNLPNTGGGILTKNVAPPDNSAQWAFAVTLMTFVGLLGLVSYNSSRTENRAPAYVTGSGSSISSSLPNSSSNLSSNPSVSNSFVRPSTGLSPAAAAARHEMESTPAILPTSVEILPGNETPTHDAKIPEVLAHGAAEFSPDGQRLAYVDKEGAVRVWNLAAHQVVRTLPQSKNHPPAILLFSRDSQNLVVTYQNQSGFTNTDQIRAWNLRTGKAGATLSVDTRKEWICAQSVLPNGKVLVLKSALWTPQKINPLKFGFFWDPNTGQQSAAPLKVDENATQIALSPDGKQFVTGNQKGRLAWSDARTGAQQAERRSSLTYGDYAVSKFSTGDNSSVFSSDTPLPIWALCFSSDGSALAARNQMQISIFGAKGQEIRTFPTAYSPAFAVSRAGNFLVEGGAWNDETRNMLWDVRENRKTRLQAPQGRFSALNFSPDGKQVFGLSTAADRVSLVTWNTAAKPIAPFSAPQAGISLPNSSTSASAISAASQLIATSNGSNIEIYGFDGNLRSNAAAGGSLNSRINFSPDGRLLAFGLVGGEARVLNAQTGNLAYQLQAMEPPKRPSRKGASAKPRSPKVSTSRDLIFSADNSLLARVEATGNQRQVELWSLKSKPRRLASILLAEPLTAMTFSTDNKSFICGGLGGSVRWYDVATQKLQGQISNGSNNNQLDRVLSLVATEHQLTAVVYEKSAVTARLYNVEKQLHPQPKVSSPKQASNFFFKKATQISFPFADPFGSYAALSSDGQFLVVRNNAGIAGNNDFSGSNREGVAIWHIATGALVQTLPFERSTDMTSDFMSFIGAISISPDFSQVTCIREDQTNRQSQIISWRRPVARRPH